jgi:hypothetical protein
MVTVVCSGCDEVIIVRMPGRNVVDEENKAINTNMYSFLKQIHTCVMYVRMHLQLCIHAQRTPTCILTPSVLAHTPGVPLQIGASPCRSTRA